MADNRHDRDKRPSPDALLAAARREDGQRGRLKIFLGAAPGVGKTFEMLTTARAKLREGLDVVAAVIETHGRSETQALIEGLEDIALTLTYADRIADYHAAKEATRPWAYPTRTCAL